MGEGRFSSGRVSLRALEETDAEALAECGKPKKAITLGIVLRDTGELVGHAGCNWNWDAHCPSVSLAVAPAHQRAGIGSEVLGMLLTHLFEDTPAHNVNGWAPSWSEPALTFARRHGFTETGRVPRGGLRDGAWFDDVMLDILRPEWAAAREGSDGARG